MGDAWDLFINQWHDVGWRYAFEESWRARGFIVKHIGNGTLIKHPNACFYSELI